jgi:acetyl-CoA acetyltransferase
MKKTLAQLRPIYVVGIGLHPYRRATECSYIELGLTAVRAALADAGMTFRDIESVYTGTALLGVAPTRAMLKYLGTTGIPMAQVENASASGSTAFRQACLEVASGITDVSLAIGLDKPAPVKLATSSAGIQDLVSGFMGPPTHFALLANEYMNRYDASAEDLAMVSVKNSRNASLNPFAQRPEAKSLEEVLAPPQISGILTRLQCCPVGEGAAAVIVMSGDAMATLGINQDRAVKVRSSTFRTEEVTREVGMEDAELTRKTTAQAYEEAGIEPADLDVVEMHDAFSIEELLYVEAMGLCPAGESASQLRRGDFDIGGRCAVSPSGGLLFMGHPLGPTGVGQICEITRQIRGEAGQRQQPNAHLGLAHMVGIGSVCAVHILSKD